MRRQVIVALAAMMVGLVVGTALPSPAADGDPLYLGSKNHAGATTKVLTRRGVLIRARAANTPAATFLVKSGPPIAVNSKTTVDDLSADLLDGRHSYQLWVSADTSSNDNLPDEQNWSTDIVVLVPTGGAKLVMNGGVGWHNDTGGYYEAGCKFQVNGTDVPGSFRADGVADNESTSCTSEALKEVPSGYHTVTFTTFAMGNSGVKLNEGSWYVMVLPN